MKWNQMTSQQQGNTLQTMQRFGGGFVSSLAEAWNRADNTNANKLGEAFPELVEKYGPGSFFYPKDAA